MKFKNLLVWNYCANLYQTLLKWFLGGFPPELCLAFPISNQDGHPSWTKCYIDPYGKFANFFFILNCLEPYWGGMVLGLVPFIIMSDDPTRQQRWPPPPNIVLHKALWENHEKIYKSGNYLLNWNQTLVEWFLVGSVSESCRWPHRQPRWPPQPN